jgi:hypothetical protein
MLRYEEKTMDVGQIEMGAEAKGDLSLATGLCSD